MDCFERMISKQAYGSIFARFGAGTHSDRQPHVAITDAVDVSVGVVFATSHNST
jgi:hypothetical protein